MWGSRSSPSRRQSPSCSRSVAGSSAEGRFRWAQYEFGENASRLELITPEVENSFLTEFLTERGPGLHHVTLEVADIDAVIAAAEEAGLSVVEHAEFEDWTEAYVSPANSTGTLFQFDSYAAGRPGAEKLFVDGQRLHANRVVDE